MFSDTTRDIIRDVALAMLLMVSVAVGFHVHSMRQTRQADPEACTDSVSIYDPAKTDHALAKCEHKDHVIETRTIEVVSATGLVKQIVITCHCESKEEL
jgi:hypothetical protein